MRQQETCIGEYMSTTDDGTIRSDLPAEVKAKHNKINVPVFRRANFKAIRGDKLAGYYEIRLVINGNSYDRQL